MRQFLKRFAATKGGASSAEYALIIAVLGGFVIAGATTFGNSLNAALSSNGKALSDSASGSF